MGPHMPTTVIDIPEKPENRYPTDRASIAVFAVCVLLLVSNKMCLHFFMIPYFLSMVR